MKAAAIEEGRCSGCGCCWPGSGCDSEGGRREKDTVVRRSSLLRRKTPPLRRRRCVEGNGSESCCGRGRCSSCDSYWPEKCRRRLMSSLVLPNVGLKDHVVLPAKKKEEEGAAVATATGREARKTPLFAVHCY
ncbi:unnamed protein product [Musa hybrid cultivar]